MRYILPLAGALLWCALPALWAQSPAESPHDLVKDVVYNELQERRQVSLWQFRVERRVAAQNTVEQAVETRSGLVYRVIARQGRPLDQAGQKKETDRLNNLVRNTSEQARMKQDYDAEEQRVERLMGAMPDAFLYTYDGTTEGNLRLSFRPNPAYNPQTYEARVYHALAGEIWIQPQLKRLVKIDGHIENEIDFGYGLFGRIEKGGTFVIGREQVAGDRWKTSLLDVHVSGRIVFFKTISKDQHEQRSDFQRVASNFSVQDAVRLLQAKIAP
jgi:YD repeat-containing protein